MSETTYRKRRKKGSFMVWIQLLLTIAVLVVLYLIDMMPLQYLVIAGAVLLVLFVFSWALCHSPRSRAGGIVLAVLVSLLLAAILAYLVKTYSVLERITGADQKTDTMSVLVLTEDPAQSLEDARDYVFGTASVDSENATTVVSEINGKLGTSVATASFTTYAEEASALLNGQIGAIVFNEAYRDTMTELYPEFSSQTRSIYDTTIRTKLSITTSSKKVTKEPFVMYITGIDVYGEISTTSRSDVNILAVVNPTTRKVLLVTTPRDSYVPLAMNGQYDKLTHAGIYGVQESVSTLENLYGIDIDYFVRVNFTGFETIVDALGGITVDSDYTFTTISGYTFYEGQNDLDGKAALAFARERKAFSDGDFQRGRNQMKIIQAILQKAMSPAILTNYSSIMDSVAGSFETSMSRSSIGDLVKLQLDDGGNWDIESYAVLGYGDSRTTYSGGSQYLSVVILDDDSLAEAKEKINQVLHGGLY